MAETKFDLLLVEDEKSLGLLYTQYLKDEPVNITHVTTGKQALAFLQQKTPAVTLLDIRLPDMLGTEILEHIKNSSIDTAVIMITAHGSINVAVDAMRGGAFDFLVKPFNRERLVQTVQNALQKQSIKSQIKKKIIPAKDDFAGFIGASDGMQVVYKMIESAAVSKAPVFITGESGTGKEICAEAIHQHSPRNGKPFVVLNCAAIPKELMESEIFGHVKGAFTGAVSDHSGAASQANGGTLFLDELCEMDLHLQTKLLRFIQTGTFQKVGGTKMEKVDIRFISATNRDPLEEIAEGRFREDLYYRLHVVPIHMPPLRERGEDVAVIARKFLGDYAKEENKNFKDFTQDALQSLQNYTWPGNVRQLQNVIRNTVVLNAGELVERKMLPSPLGVDYAPHKQGYARNPIATAKPEQAYIPQDEQAYIPAQKDPQGKILPLWKVEQTAIENAINLCDGNIPQAAAYLGISASTIYRKKQIWKEEEEKLSRNYSA